MLDGLAARLAAQQASSAEIAALRDNLSCQAGAQDIDTIVRLNEHFHAIIARAARNRYLVHALDALETPLALLPGTTYEAKARPAEALKQHRRLVAAIEARDGAMAEQVAHDHIGSAERIRLLMLAEDRDGGPRS